MTSFSGNIEKITLENNNFRQVVYTGKYAQLVVMSLLPSEDIGMEVHETVDQFIRIEKGTGRAIVNGEESSLGDGSVVIIPAGIQHNILNLSASEPLKLYTLYSPPHHRDGVVHKTKKDAESDTTDRF